MRKLTGKNRGISGSTTTGICATSFINQLVANHSNHRHDGHTRDRAMREDMLSHLSDEVRPSIAHYDENGPWSGLVRHFLQTCGPSDILAGVYAMLEEAHSEEPERNLQQRVQLLVVAWTRAQSTYYGVCPEQDGRGFNKPPHFSALSYRCSNNTPSRKNC